MDALNIFFGIISIIAFGYAIIESRKADSLKQLTRRITLDIRAIAIMIADKNSNTSTEGFARSIVQLLESLVVSETSSIKVGQVKVKYRAFEIPPLHTDCGAIVDDPDAKFGKALRGMIEGGSEKGLVYGPYEHLPVNGIYQACFRLKCTSTDTSHTIDISKPIVRLDVFNYNGSGKLAERFLNLSDMTIKFSDYIVQFRYTNVMATLEYRVAITQPSVELSFELVTITRLSS